MRASTRERPGLTRTVLAVILIFVVLMAGIAVYALAFQGASILGPTTSSVQTTSSTSSASATTQSSTFSTTTTSSSTTSSTTGSPPTTSATTTSSSAATTSSSTITSSTSSSNSSSSGGQTSTNTTSSCTPGVVLAAFPPVEDLATLLGAYSSLSMTSYNTTAPSSSIVQTNSSYSVVYASAVGNLTTYKVQFREVTSISSSLSTAWIRSDGTVLAFDAGTGNETGPQATGALASSAEPFIALIVQGELLGLYTLSPQVQPANQTSVTFGSTQVYVTNFGTRALPATISTCEAEYTLTTFSLQAATVPGSNLILITSENIRGTSVSGSTTTQLFADLQLVSVTLG